MTSTLITNSQTPGVEVYEDMFKEITRKLYGEESSQNVHTPAHITPATPVSDAERSFPNLLSDRTSTSGDYDHGVAVENVSALKSDDHLTAFGLALMQNGFPTPNAILNSHTFHQINKQNHTNPTASNALNSFSSNLNSVQGHSNTSNELNLPKSTQHANELNAWKCESYPNSHQKQFKNKKQDVMLTPTQHLTNDSLKSANDMNGINNNASTIQSQSGQTLQKRYNCTNCTYSSDRRDLFTRHENIHKEDKPFHCYVCLKQFNRADHVKKHFLRMHRGLNYDICRTKRSLPQQKSKKANTSTTGYNHTSGIVNIPTNFHATLQNSNVEQSPQTSIIDQTNQHLGNTFAGGSGTPQSHQLNVKVEKNSEKTTIPDKRFMCCYCSWSGNDNWGLKRHLNTHTKPFLCVLCEYKAARSERLATHVLKVHNKKICTKCNFLAENQNEYNNHVNEAHANETRSHRSSQANTTDSRSTANNILRNANNSFGENNSFDAMQSGTSNQTINNWRLMNNTGQTEIAKTNGNSNQKRGAERLFQYFEAGDSDPEEDYARQLQMAAISRNTAAVAQDFHNAGGGNQTIDTFPTCKLHIFDKNTKQFNEFLSSNNIKIDPNAKNVANLGSMIEQYFTISPPAKQIQQFDQNEKENMSLAIMMPYKNKFNLY